MERFATPQPKKKIKKEPVLLTNYEVAPKKPNPLKESEEINGPSSNNKNYVCVGSEAISAIAESIGIANIAEDVAASLSEDVSYRLQEIINASCTLMRKSKRRKLRTSDVNSAFQTSNVHHIFGHNQKEPFNFLRLPEGDLYVAEDHEVDLISVVRSNNLPKLKKPSYVTTSYPILQNVQALPVNGHVKTEGNPFSFLPLKSGVVNGDGCAEASLSNSHKGTYQLTNKPLNREKVLPPDGRKRPPVSNGPNFKPALDSRSKLNGRVRFAPNHGIREKLKRDSEEEFQLSRAQLLFFKVIARCIIDGHHQLFQQALEALYNNKKADAVCAPLLNFVALSVCHIPRHYGFLTRLLETVEVLLNNGSTNPNHSIAVNRIVNALLAVVADQNVIRGKNDFVLRRKAARLLTRVLFTWGIEEQHVAELLSRIARVLGDGKEKIQSYYGALVIFQSLGKAAIGWLFPLLKDFLPLLEKRFPSASPSTNTQLEDIRSVLLDIVEFLFCDANSYRFKSKVTTSHEVHAYIQLDTLLYQYCGDAVCARRRPSHFKFLEIQKKRINAEKLNRIHSNSKARQQVHSHLDLRYISNYPQKQKQNNYEPNTLEEAFVAPVIRRKDIQFRFAGANPVPKDGLRKKVLDRTHVQFIPASSFQVNTSFPRQYLMVGRMHHSSFKGTRPCNVAYDLLNVL